MVCPECGGGNAPGADRCGHCGADLAAWRRPPALITVRRAGRRRGAGGAAYAVGVAMILPLALAGYIEATSDLRLAPVPLIVALLLAAGGAEVLLRASSAGPDAMPRRARGPARGRGRGRAREPFAAGGG